MSYKKKRELFVFKYFHTYCFLPLHSLQLQDANKTTNFVNKEFVVNNIFSNHDRMMQNELYATHIAINSKICLLLKDAISSV